MTQFLREQLLASTSIISSKVSILAQALDKSNTNSVTLCLESLRFSNLGFSVLVVDEYVGPSTPLHEVVDTILSRVPGLSAENKTMSAINALNYLATEMQLITKQLVNDDLVDILQQEK